ncbi:MAG TPA: bifunctional chorismate mutase/prephenate dehydrogenase [Polyangiaceae bacterium]|nr:bifunctional chorismate mutase/prephenate dehydrogenase [Polyangiaceae bacterium]
MSDLDELRRRLDEIDDRLLGVAKERLEVVAQIKAIKKAEGLRLFDRGREQEVHRRAESRARGLGLDPELGRDLIARLIEASHQLQAEREAAAEADEGRSVLIVGGRGRMGTMIGRAFADRGHQIDVLERDDDVDPSRIGAADVVMVAVPMADAARVVGEVAPHVRADALLCDINSLKTEVCEALQNSGGEALGTHPMFGPTVRSLRRQKVVLCDVKPGPGARWLEAELGAMGAEIIKCSPEHHDAMMGVVQVLTHFGIMAMGRTLRATGHTLDETLPFTSPIYRLELAMVGRLFSQKPELYREIMLANPAGEGIRAAFLEQARHLAELIDRGDGDAFVEAFDEVHTYFAGFSDEAMELSDHIIETIMARP